MIKILIVDNHAIVRRGLKHILMDTPDIELAGEATNGNEALMKIRDEIWDVVLLDLTMPGKSGMDVLKQVKNELPKLPILILSTHPEDQYGVRAIKAGAAGYITKNCQPDQLVAAIRRVAGGGKYITPTLADKLAWALDTSTNNEEPHELLSDREYQIFQLLVSGNKISTIAKDLSLSAKTISAHRANILKKMNMTNNAELMYYAIGNELMGDG